MVVTTMEEAVDIEADDNNPTTLSKKGEENQLNERCVYVCALYVLGSV